MNNFIDILMDNNEEKLKLFLLSNGKEPKPISPFIFEEKMKNKEEQKDGINEDNNG